MIPDPRTAGRRRAPPPIRRSAGASGLVHATVLAVALFGYPVIDIVFAPFSATPQDVLAHGESDRARAAGNATALDTSATEKHIQTVGGRDPAHDVPTDSAGEVGYTVAGDSPDPQKRAGRPDTRPVPPLASAAEPTREILVMVTLRPDRPDQPRGSDAGRERIAAADGTDDGEDDRDRRLDAIVLAVTGEDERFARAITHPQSADIGGLPDPANGRKVRLLTEAAEAGYARARFALARQYIVGDEPQATMRKAVALLRDAAERGDVDAQLLLGAIYAQGRIVRQDLVEAELFLTLAAARGVPGVERAIAAVERDMTLGQVIDARRIGRAYRTLLDALPMPQADGTRGDLLRDELLDAAAAGDIARIARALARGADLEATDGVGRTAVINAAWRGRNDAIELLLALGADFDARDDKGRSALAWAASNGHVAIVDRLAVAGADLDALDDDGTTALMRAAWNGHTAVVGRLVDAGASVGVSDRTGNTALDYAARSGRPDIAAALRRVGT